MKIDLHIHCKDCSDGRMSLEAIFQEAFQRGVQVLSITDHDSMDCQRTAKLFSDRYGIYYIHGLELNVSFSRPDYKEGNPISLDFLAYGYDIADGPLKRKLEDLRNHRRRRAEKILENINEEFKKDRIPLLAQDDMKAIEASVDGAFGRPHIANYLVRKGIVSDKQEAFDRYLVRCDVPKMPLSLSDASYLVRGAGGKLILAHPNDPNGTSLVSFSTSVEEQQKIIRENMLPYIDGIECWHSRHQQEISESYLSFAKGMGLMVTGGSDCHQDPICMGEVSVPEFVAHPFLSERKG